MRFNLPIFTLAFTLQGSVIAAPVAERRDIISTIAQESRLASISTRSSDIDERSPVVEERSGSSGVEERSFLGSLLSALGKIGKKAGKARQVS
ncbi:hypothetical protein C8R45DRAFT_1038283 [Mycena sanguinolenta]|nr:hypothetical protein C8R45DRAFT_1038283 [Mycena sanguinolenta]